MTIRPPVQQVLRLGVQVWTGNAVAQLGAATVVRSGSPIEFRITGLSGTVIQDCG